MDFTNRSAPAQQNHDAEPVAAAQGINVKRPVSSGGKQQAEGKWTRIGVVGSLVAVVILIVAVIVLVLRQPIMNQAT